MSGETKIEWSDFTWNPIRGCSRVSPGCGGPNHQGGCYAEKIAARFSGPGQPFEGFAERGAHGGRWTGKMALVEDMLELPLRWRKPRRIFVNSMSDLFHENLPDEVIDKVFAVMALASQHTYQILTKRADRMCAYMSAPDVASRMWHAAGEIADDNERLYLAALAAAGADWGGATPWPLPQIWLGVSVEDRERKPRIDDLRNTPAAVRFLSCEPLLEDLGALDLTGINLAIVGGESGPRSRPFWVPWARSILRQCRKQHVACFIKQMGANVQDRNDAGFDDCDNGWNLEDEVAQVERDINGFSEEYQGAPVRIHLKDRKGGDMAEWPGDLRVREMPT